MAVQRGGHPVAGTVDVDKLAGLRKAVDRGQVYLCPGRLLPLRGAAHPVPVDLIVSSQHVI